MPGPRPTPSAIREALGNPSKRPLPPDEPKPDATLPDRPTGLTGDARKAWDLLAPGLHSAGILTAIDGDGLESYCRLYSACRDCWRKVKSTGGPVVMIAGKPEANPYLREAHRLETLLHKVRSELGLNATSRSRIKAEVSQEEDDLDAFLKFPGAA